jgi:hypothetical protein
VRRGKKSIPRKHSLYQKKRITCLKRHWHSHTVPRSSVCSYWIFLIMTWFIRVSSIRDTHLSLTRPPTPPLWKRMKVWNMQLFCIPQRSELLLSLSVW